MKHRFFRLLLGVWLLSVTASCQSPAPAEAPVSTHFVRSGLLVEGTLGQVEVFAQGRPLPVRRLDLPDKRQLLTFAWTPGGAYEVMVGSVRSALTAPARPEPAQVFTLPLEGDAARASSALVDASLAFSPDGRTLAVGTLFGQLSVLEVPSGKPRFTKTFPEGMVKKLAFSPDGATLYVGEQSPQGLFHALDARSGEERWHFRLADELEPSVLPPGEDRYAIYFLPGVYDLKVTAAGEVVVAGTHSWQAGGQWHNRARLYVFSPAGDVLWRFPEQGPLDGTLVSLALDGTGRHAVVSVARSATTPKGTLPQLSPGVYGLNLAERVATWGHVFTPLLPHFKDVYLWQALALSADGSSALAGLGDGRVFVLDATQKGPSSRVVATLDAGTPVDVAGVPVASPVSWALAAGSTLYAQTNTSNLPFGTSATAKTAPAPHPGARTLYALDEQGRPLWRYQAPFVCSGLASDAQGALLLTTTSDAGDGSRTDRNGLLLLDARPELASDARVLFTWPTSGPLFFQPAISPDGLWLAGVETPARKDDGKTVYGHWQLIVVH